MTRREFPKSVRRAAHARSNGICECAIVPFLPTYRAGCGRRLTSGNVWYEHIIPDGAGGTPTLDNCAALVKTCGLLKSRIYDAPVVAKVSRQRDRNISAQTHCYRPLPGTKRSGIRLPFRGGPVWRDSGRLIHGQHT